YQAGIIRRKLAGGLDLNTILQVSAAPGYSEHHTGRAFDVSSPDSAVLEESFEHSVGFAWLSHNAARFGFVMSLPRDNAAGYIYEPWHWLYQPTSSTMT
uniref:M15 family metallopeptidase n=1 Tax=Chitinimonas sp. TaxID=1934313 RepID=UPI0035B0F3FD